MGNLICFSLILSIIQMKPWWFMSLLCPASTSCSRNRRRLILFYWFLFCRCITNVARAISDTVREILDESPSRRPWNDKMRNVVIWNSKLFLLLYLLLQHGGSNLLSREIFEFNQHSVHMHFICSFEIWKAQRLSVNKTRTGRVTLWEHNQRGRREIPQHYATPFKMCFRLFSVGS